MSKGARRTRQTRRDADIDGVFKYGREWSKDGSRALRRITDAGMPFVFVTNGGGGLTEASYAGSMTSKIASASQAKDPVTIGPERMVLSYTPWKTMLAPGLDGGRVLLIGDPREKVLEVAKNYGINATHYQDYAIEHDTINPFRAAKMAGTSPTASPRSPPPSPHSQRDTPSRRAPKGEVPFAAILVCATRTSGTRPTRPPSTSSARRRR